jgi:aminopeptidase N
VIGLNLDPESDQFSGEVGIEVAVRVPVSDLMLHAHQLIAKSASIQLIGAGSAASKPIELQVEANEKAQMWRLVPIGTPTIARGSYRLQIRYTGRVNQNDAGLYQAPHVADGQPARMLATQLEAVFARRLFPGFDEPAFRSVFDITVRAPKAYAVVSNMPAKSTTPAPDSVDHTVHRFEPTPAMPTYLVAVAVGKFDVLEGQSGRVKLRILTAPGKRDQGGYALSATQKILPFYNEYFGVEYVLPKLDQFAVPSTRDGAMEDWGLISYNEAGLLFDPLKSGPRTQRGIFSVVAHEIAHQWFGNLVTAASWEEIWLNEAFATWLAEKATALSVELGEPFPQKTLDLLQHIVLSHHGSLEFGSPKLPMIPEAFMVHYLDNLDAKTWMCLHQIANDPDPNSPFTSFHKQLETRIYKRSGEL